MRFKNFFKRGIVCVSVTCLAFSGNVISAFAQTDEEMNGGAFVDIYNSEVRVDDFADENATAKGVKDNGTSLGVANAVDSNDAETSGKSEDKKEPLPIIESIVKNGEAAFPDTDDISKKFKVTVTIGADGRIESVKDNGSSIPFKFKKQCRDFWGKYKGENYYKGKCLEDVLAMDVENGFGAHVPGSRTEESAYAIPAKGVRLAVLNALGWDNLVQASDSDIIVTGEAVIDRYKYKHKVKVRITKNGRIVEVTDNGTMREDNYGVTHDDIKRITVFEKGGGYNKYKGRTIKQIKEMDISKHGVDGVSGATYSSSVVRRAVLNGFENAGFDTSVKADSVRGRVFRGESENSFDSAGNKIKIKAYIDDNFRIIKVEDDGSVPGEKTWEGMHHTDSSWDKFAKYKGFAKYRGKNIDEIKAMDMNDPDSIDVAGRQLEISSIAREAVLAALKQAIENPPVDKPVLEDVKESTDKEDENVPPQTPGVNISDNENSKVNEGVEKKNEPHVLQIEKVSVDSNEPATGDKNEPLSQAVILSVAAASLAVMISRKKKRLNK